MILGIIVLVSVFQGLVFFGHWIIYKGVIGLLHIQQPGILTTIKWVLFFLSLTFSVATILSQKFIGALIDWFYTFAAIWLGTLMLLSLTIVAGFLLGMFIPALKASSLFGALIFAVGFLLSAYGLWNSFHTQVTSYQVKLANLPAAWQGKKIVMLADTHFGNIRGKKTAEQFAALINAQKPEIVLIPGDFYDGPPTNYQISAEIFGKLKAPQGVYFATGNHEEFHQDNSEYLQALKNGGVKILYNQMVNLNGLQLLGVTYKDSNNVESLKKLLAQIPFDKNLPSILLKHAPQAIEGAADSGISLEVSGHTHKGQMWPISLITKWMFKGYDYGMKNYKTMVQITTSGAGTWGPPQRLGTKAEIVVITLN